MDTRQALRELLEQIDTLSGIEFSRDVDPLEAETCWAGAMQNAFAALESEDKAKSELVEAAREEAKFLDELLVAIENAAADIGGSRPTDEILEDLGPANDALLEALAKHARE